MNQLGFHGVVFDEGLASAVRPDGERLRFTRQERALLAQFLARPRRLFTRDELYASIGSRGSDRNVDYVINTLRGKLEDRGRERRFISTQYGEGYVWVAPATEITQPKGFLIIVPRQGASVGRLLPSLRDALQRRLPPDRIVLLAADAHPSASFHFTLEARVHRGPDGRHVAFALQRSSSTMAAAAFRETFRGEPNGEVIDRLAAEIVDAMWMHLALGPGAVRAPTDQPLHLRMLDASALLGAPGPAWLSNGEQLARQRAQAPDDPVLGLMWAMHIFAMITLIPGPEPLTRARVAALDDEITALVEPNLAALRADPVLALAAAKLLLLRRDAKVDLAEALATEAFAGSAAFAAAFPMLGQVKAYRGEAAAAQALYDEGLALCEPGSSFEAYLLVLKAVAFVADDRHDAAGALLDRLEAIQPGSVEAFGLFFLPPGDDGPARRLARLADNVELAEARRLMAYLYFRYADLFQRPEQVANVMRGPLTHLVRRLGPEVVSEELWRELPSELAYLNEGRTRRASARRDAEMPAGQREDA